jgi:hypothetical protein
MEFLLIKRFPLKCGEESPPFNSNNGETITMKGFLYKTPEGVWILSKEADLKTCCVGSSQKLGSQITLVGDFSTFNLKLPIQVTGTLESTQEGAYMLSDVQATQKHNLPVWTIGLCSVVLLLIGFKLKRLLLP